MVPSRGQRPVGVLVKIFPKLSETFILEELLGLERAGLDLQLYTLADPTDALRHPDVARVRARPQRVPSPATVRAVASLASHHLRLLAHRPAAWLREAARALGAGRQALTDFARAGWLAARLREARVGHLHVHFIDRTADLARSAAALAGVPFSISAHAKDIYLSDAPSLRRRLGAARFTVSCTDFNCAMLRRVAPDAPIHRMYHGVDAARFAPRDGRARDHRVPVLLSVGRLRAKKGLDTLVDACARLRDRGRAFRCEIVGYGEEHDRLGQRIAALGLAGQVDLLGKLARDAVIERYAGAAVYVQPSRITADGDRDGIPNVLLEAMAMALPVVATRVSGIPELVRDGDNGLLVEPDDAAALADACERLLDDAALGERLGATARARVIEQFDNDHNLQLVRRLLQAQDDDALAEPYPSRAAA